MALDVVADVAAEVATDVAAELLAFDEVTLLVTELATLLLLLPVAGVQLVEVGNASGVSPVRFMRKLFAGTFSVMPSEKRTYCGLQPKL